MPSGCPSYRVAVRVITSSTKARMSSARSESVGSTTSVLNQKDSTLSNARERLTTKAERRNAFEIFHFCDLAGRVATQCKCQVVSMDARAIISHPDQLRAASLDVDLDPITIGIDAVFEKFLDDGSRSLNDFSRRYLVG